MTGDAISFAEETLETVVRDLRSDPHALETVDVSVITFGENVVETIPRESLCTLPRSRIECSGDMHLDQALLQIAAIISRDNADGTNSGKRAWPAGVLIVSRGRFEEGWQESLDAWSSLDLSFALAVSPTHDSNIENLQRCANEVMLREPDHCTRISHRLLEFLFAWIEAPTSSRSTPA